MIAFFSIKTFLVLYALFLVFFAAYVYCGDGSREHEERILIIGFFGALNLCLFLFLTVMKPEIKSFMSQIRAKESIEVRPPSSANETLIGVVLRKSLCVSNVSDVDDFVDALKRKDAAFLDRMVIEGRAFFVLSDARVYRSNSGIYDGVVFITFLEGEFTNRSGYTFKKCVPTIDEYLADRENMYIPDSNR